MADTMQDVVNEAAALLNDSDQELWNNKTLLPFIRKAHREMQVKLQINGIGAVRKTSTIITVPALSDINNPGIPLPNQPADLVEPIELYERPTGTTYQFETMEQRSWEVNQLPGQYLNYWDWDQELIQLLGATQSNDVKLHYLKGITIPLKPTDTLGFTNAILFLAPRSAAIAATTVDQLSTANTCNADAQAQFSQLIRLNVKGDQDVPVRRLGYRRTRRLLVMR